MHFWDQRAWGKGLRGYQNAKTFSQAGVPMDVLLRGEGGVGWDCPKNWTLKPCCPVVLLEQCHPELKTRGSPFTLSWYTSSAPCWQSCPESQMARESGKCSLQTPSPRGQCGRGAKRQKTNSPCLGDRDLSVNWPL